MAYKVAVNSFEASMALPPQDLQTTAIEDAFVADRAMFWGRFTGFTKGAVIAVALLLIAMFLFLR